MSSQYEAARYAATLARYAAMLAYTPITAIEYPAAPVGVWARPPPARGGQRRARATHGAYTTTPRAQRAHCGAH